ncbi:MAG: TadE/TadG family type IV pilus assembly protein [Marinibacterium sp.]
MSRSFVGAHLTAFWRDTRGVVSLEFALIIPLLFWTLGALYVYFEGYRQSTVNLKAAYTISDVISRETGGIDDSYMDTMHDLMGFLVRTSHAPALRVSVLRWDAGEDRFFVDWSKTRGWNGEMTDNNVMAYASKLPSQSNGDRIIVVETSTSYDPAFKVGLGSKQLKNFVVTRPRFAPLVAWTGSA